MANYCKKINNQRRNLTLMTNLFLGPKAKQITARGQKCHLGQGPQQWSLSRYVEEVPSRAWAIDIK